MYIIFHKHLNRSFSSLFVMARPIEVTPTLYGKEAIAFLKHMLEEQKNPNPRRIKTLQEAAKIKFNYVD